MIYLITGKAGAGKTHYANLLAKELEEEGKKVKVIDGDEWRETKGNDDFSCYGRIMNLLDAAIEASYWEERGYVCILSFVSPYRDWRNMMRKHWRKSLVIYIPGGSLWEGTTYERPQLDELKIKRWWNFLFSK